MYLRNFDDSTVIHIRQCFAKKQTDGLRIGYPQGRTCETLNLVNDPSDDQTCQNAGLGGRSIQKRLWWDIDSFFGGYA